MKMQMNYQISKNDKVKENVWGIFGFWLSRNRAFTFPVKSVSWVKQSPSGLISETEFLLWEKYAICLTVHKKYSMSWECEIVIW